MKGAGNSLVFQNPSLYYIILGTVKHVRRVGQAVLDRLIKIMVKALRFWENSTGTDEEAVNLLKANGRALSFGLISRLQREE